MAKTYRTKQGDTIDLIVYKEYGYTKGAVELVYKANEFLLLEQSFLLEPGLILTLPNIRLQDSLTSINPIWQ